MTMTMTRGEGIEEVLAFWKEELDEGDCPSLEEVLLFWQRQLEDDDGSLAEFDSAQDHTA